MLQNLRARAAVIAVVVAALNAGDVQAEAPLTYEQTWQRVLAYHPSLAAAEAEVLAGEAQVQQAGRGLNPELELEIENVAGSGDYAGFDGTDVTLQLAQTWERGGKAGHRRHVAESRAAVARLRREQQRLELRADLRRAFVAVLAAELKVELADTLAAVAEQDRDVVARRVSAGAESHLAAKRADIALAEARRARDRAAEEGHLARIQLGNMWGAAEGDFPPLTGSLEVLMDVPTWPAVLEQSASSPALRLAAGEAESARAAMAVARSLGAVDLTTAAGVRRFGDGGDTAFVLSLGVPLPVRDNNRDAVRAAGYEMERAVADTRAAAVTLQDELASAWGHLAAARADLESMRRDILPAAAEAMREAQRTYARGRFSLTDVLAVRRTWIEWHIRHAEALAQHHTAAADLAALLGNDPGPVPDNLEVH